MMCARAAVTAVLLLSFATLSVAQDDVSGARDLTAVSRLLSSLARQEMSEGERAAASADVSVLTDAIAGMPARDAAAYALLALGYSPRETADVVSGRISRRALDVARQMLSAGQTSELAANYLDGQYKRALAMRSRPNIHLPSSQDDTGVTDAAFGVAGLGVGRFSVLIDGYSKLYNVSAALIRAMVMTESAFRPDARSRAGAIGLMQLMPATARELGVDPTRPEQNIEGGIRYFSELLRMFGTTELALIAYNGGPGYARRYARRETALYGETRDYVRKVLARLVESPRP